MYSNQNPTIFLNRLSNGDRQVLHELPKTRPTRSMVGVGGSFVADFLDQGDFRIGVHVCVVKFIKLLFENTLKGSISNIEDGDVRRDALYASLVAIKNLSYRRKHTVNEKLAQRMPQRFIQPTYMETA